MTDTARHALVPASVELLRRELTDPLIRNGYALIASSGMTGLLGLVFWLLTARFYPAAAVGKASAAYAAMNLLAGVTALNFTGALTRFIPRAGGQTRQLVIRAYAVSATASAVLAAAFVVTARWWGPSYAGFGHPVTGLVFGACVVVWALFTLQDSVLIGLRGAFWVFAENSAFGVVKLVLLVLLVTAVPGHAGLYVAWMLPAVLAVPLINSLIFGRLVPRHVAATPGARLPGLREIGRFLAGDYSGSMFVLTSFSLVPVVVAARSDAASTAYFYMAWLIAGILDMIAINMGMSLTVEGSFDTAALAANCRKTLRRMALMLVPCVILLAVLAPWWLRLFGPAYSVHGARILELLAAAALPTGVTEVYLGALRAQNRASLVALIQLARAAGLLVLTVILTASFGTLGAGVGALASQTAIAVPVSVGLWRIVAGDRKTLRLPAWSPTAGVGAATAAGLIVFFVSLRGVDLGRMNGLGLLSVLPAGALAGVTLVALAIMAGLALPRADRAHRVVLGVALAGLAICLDGITVFTEPEPRFPTAYQIAGYVQYVASTGHAAPGLAAYFSWPGFFALVSFVAGAAGTHGLLPLLRIWPVAIDLLCLPPLFLIMRGLRIPWRAQWLAGFLFIAGNWVGQDYFSPQAFGYLLYLVFIAILVNWFTGAPRPRLAGSPGGTPAASSRQKAFLFTLLVALFTVTTVSHQLTPLFMIGACTVLVAVRRCTLRGLPILLAVILAGWVSYETVAFWSGHLSNLLGGIGDLGVNLDSSVGGRLVGSSATHLLALRARIILGAVFIGLAVLGALRRRLRGTDDRILLALLAMPLAMVVVQSYGGEIALRIYLFMLPAACPLAAAVFFPGTRPPAHAARPVSPAGSTRPGWRVLSALAACALILPAAFFLARYGNEAFEQTPPGELSATNWVYAHDAHGARVLWLSTAPQVDVTPEMPWEYRDQDKVIYIPSQAPRDPARVRGLVSDLRESGPGSYLIVAQTEVATLEQTASYEPGWGHRFNAAMTAARGVRVAFSAPGTVVYTLHWPRGARHQPLGLTTAGPDLRPSFWNPAGAVVLWLLLAVLAGREFIRIRRPAGRLIRTCTLVSLPLLVLLTTAITLRFLS